MKNISFKEKPRTGKFSDKAGAYHLASRVFSSTVNPGEIVKFEQYITGYGEIKNPKIRCYISTEIFDIEKSTVLHSIKKENDTISFGNQLDNISDDGFVCHISGVQNDGWDEPTLVFDISGEDTKTVFTEQKTTNAPFYYNLKLKDRVEPGDYFIDFYFTFYNGNSWICNKESIQIKVRNFFERYAKEISALAIIATLLSIFRFGLIPLVKWLFQCFT